MRAVIYSRVSTKDQVQNLSLATQEKACADYCRQHGWAVDRVFVEKGESAKTEDRTEFRNLIAYCAANKGRIQFLVVYALNRFSRDRLVHFSFRSLLQKFGISLRSATEPIDYSSTGRFMETIFAGIAQLDNDVRAERTTVGMKAALERGRWTFGVPLGYRRIGGRGSSVDQDPERAPMVRKAFELLATGLFTKQEVLREITKLGLRTLSGKPVSGETFQQMVRNPLYAGLMQVKGWSDCAPQRGTFEAIVSSELFSRVQNVLDGKRLKLTTYQRNHPDFPLRGFVRCAECDTPLTASWSKGRSGAKYAYYRCRYSACRAVNVRMEKLEPDFVEYLEALTPKREYLPLFRAIVMDVWHQHQEDARANRERLQQRLEEVQARKDRAVEAFLHERSIDRATYDRHVESLDVEITMAKVALHEARLEEIDIDGVVGFAEHVLGQPARLWSDASADQRQRLQKVLFPQGVMYSRNGRFGTAETSAIFRLLQSLDPEKSREASPTGFEPAPLNTMDALESVENSSGPRQKRRSRVSPRHP
jgi:site-specific DNA recombinase